MGGGDDGWSPVDRKERNNKYTRRIRVPRIEVGLIEFFVCYFVAGGGELDSKTSRPAPRSVTYRSNLIRDPRRPGFPFVRSRRIIVPIVIVVASAPSSLAPLPTSTVRDTDLAASVSYVLANIRFHPHITVAEQTAELVVFFSLRFSTLSSRTKSVSFPKFTFKRFFESHALHVRSFSPE